jgi:formate/nitrite transporter FocA (FNT family)
MASADAEHRPHLNQEEEHEVEHRTSVRVRVVHEAIRRDGEVELNRPAAALAWSGLAAGLSMGFSLFAEGVLRYRLPQADWAWLVSKLGYPLGFLIVIIGKQQLFTENTLTPILPAMENRDAATFRKLARLWTVVFLANMAGVHLIAVFFALTPVLKPELQPVLVQIAQEATSLDAWTAFIRGIPAGWLIAMIVWLRAATESGEVMIIVILTYAVAIGGFTHIIVGSVEYVYLVCVAGADWVGYVRNYLAPVFLGNVLGGVTIVATLHHKQVSAEEDQP